MSYFKDLQNCDTVSLDSPSLWPFIKIDRFSGSRLPDGASGDNVVSECFRAGEEPLFGIQFDGGWAMSGDFDRIQPGGEEAREVTTSTGRKAVVGPRASFGTLSSGGLY